MRTLHLCAGHGGGLLASLILGHPIVGAVEYDDFAQSVLRARQRDGLLPLFPIHGDLRTYDGRSQRGAVDLVAGGIPCQGFSGAGKQLGEHDPRNLWPDALRVLRETRAPWFFLENVDRLTSFDYWGVILQDLAAAGYDARWCVLAAGDVGAPHLRKRIWLLATDTTSFREQGQSWQPDGAALVGAGAGTGGGADGGDATAGISFGVGVAALRETMAADATGDGREPRRTWSDIKRQARAVEYRRELAHAHEVGGEVGRPVRERVTDVGDSGPRLVDMPHVSDGPTTMVEHWRDHLADADRLGSRTKPRLSTVERTRVSNPLGSSGNSAGNASTSSGHDAQPDLGGVADGLADRLDRPGWWDVERGLPRVAGKQPNRAERLRGLGNGQVALCAAAAYRLLGGP